jgi:hypothetical protein
MRNLVLLPGLSAATHVTKGVMMQEHGVRKKAVEYEREQWKSESTLVCQAYYNSCLPIPTIVLAYQALWL